MTWLVDADVTEPVIATGVNASGGTESVININGQAYRLHTFTSTDELLVFSGGMVEVLAVGGGGAGGVGRTDELVSCGGGGGGGGGVVNCQLEVFGGGGFLGEYDITVGAGGNADFGTPPTNGGDSVIITSGVDQVRAKGGGRGGNVTLIASGNAVDDGQDGGSSGGGAVVFRDNPSYTNQSSNAGSRVFGQGNNGADAISDTSGGGGGAGEPARVARFVSGTKFDVFPNGGNGVANSITGTLEYYGGGGGGGNSFVFTKPKGGLGGGGDGVTNSINNRDGQANTGGGGGGGGGGYPGAGGSGIVIVRYPIGV